MPDHQRLAQQGQPISKADLRNVAFLGTGLLAGAEHEGGEHDEADAVGDLTYSARAALPHVPEVMIGCQRSQLTFGMMFMGLVRGLLGR